MEISYLIPLLVTCSGVFFMIKMRGGFFLRPVVTAKQFLTEMKNQSSRRSLCLALAGTLGVGNIFGVSAGLLIGGEGSLFWLAVSSFFAMVIKYVEAYTVCSVDGDDRGMSGLIEKTFPGSGRHIARIYALFTVILAFFMGASMQVGATIDAAEHSVGLDSRTCIFVLLILFAPCLVGGVNKIERFTEIIIPMTTIIYITICFSVILMNFNQIPSVLSRVISSAFSSGPMIGGISAVAIKEGFARGILSNEAGVGSSALAHSRGGKRSAHIAGLFGASEVFFDTTLLCGLTGFSILLTVDDLSRYKTPMNLVSSVFIYNFGYIGGLALTALTFLFAYSTIICWYFYGLRMSSAYFPFLTLVFPVAFVLFIVISPLIKSDFLLYVVDILLLSMSTVTICTIIKRTCQTSINVK